MWGMVDSPCVWAFSTVFMCEGKHGRLCVWFFFVNNNNSNKLTLLYVLPQIRGVKTSDYVCIKQVLVQYAQGPCLKVCRDPVFTSQTRRRHVGVTSLRRRNSPETRN